MDIIWESIFTIGSYDISIMDIIDLSLVTYLVYRLYKLARGTAAINIFFSLIAIYFLYQLVDVLRMKFITQILGGFISITFIVIVILFQQEIRKYLSQLGKGKLIKNKHLLKFFNSENKENLNIKAIVKACREFQKTKTGAIIVITQTDDLSFICENAVQIDSKISYPLIESIFYKNSPLHDGAIVIRNNRIVAARCILPVTNDDDFPGELGMRHRAAVGVSEYSDALTIIISEQNGKISSAHNGKIRVDLSEIQLRNVINKLN
tara:strand:- start:590 stop:1381 length:792 start_codon:yes stop_codon:yes gene_type:complete